MVNEIKRIDIKEFRERGYLQELNRQFLHPLGLAMEVIINDDDTEALGGVWDYREDPEGIVFGMELSEEKASNVALEQCRGARRRKNAFDWKTHVQPIDDPITADDRRWQWLRLNKHYLEDGEFFMWGHVSKALMVWGVTKEWGLCDDEVSEDDFEWGYARELTPEDPDWDEEKYHGFDHWYKFSIEEQEGYAEATIYFV